MTSKMPLLKAKTIKQSSTGFSLVEVLVVITIASIMSAYGIPAFRRSVSQGHVDRYTQFLKSGLYSLRSRLGKYKKVCSLDLDKDLPTKEFGPPWKLVEFKQPNGRRSNSERLRCCYNENDHKLENSDLYKCTAIDLNGKTPYRFLAIEGTRESKEVEVSALQPKYELTPSGISAHEFNNLTILVRSVHSESEPLLRTRCIELSGSAQIHSGTWNEDNEDAKFCDSS